ncbi:hypothetical protein FHR81_003610 [Actinoalloteichus hoggarensis]|uniref:Uncharacterized protein n=1 Tax=Actinoalloteichus hoggarensis TaxID=1470176 RepID=A0A221WAB3_9PSEU|nr:hypothetical protein [Actinoalloteichus hoggarensis]ASO22950.1 hypothetical protein AHOG_26755 [Actinoalloteichus hoggarensis]MBB5922553.1 hypothetical protein [Actinoalloteichus hoggarensis]
MELDLTATHLLAGLGVALTLGLVWRAGARRARAAADKARGGGRLLSLLGRVSAMSGVIVGVQWIVITYRASTPVLLVVLGLPALFAAYTVTRALTVTTSDVPRRRGDRR